MQIITYDKVKITFWIKERAFMRIQRINLLVFLTLFLAGCGRSSKKSSSQRERARQSQSSQQFVQEGGTYVFNDDADEFSLEEEGVDPFGNNDSDENDNFQWESIVYDTDAGEVIRFDFDDTTIKPAEMAKVEHNVELAKHELEQNPNCKVTVKGHACKITKSELSNQAISQERAENVAKVYAEQGVPKSKMSAVGYGSSELLTDEDGLEAQGVNRRVETDFLLLEE